MPTADSIGPLADAGATTNRPALHVRKHERVCPWGPVSFGSRGNPAFRLVGASRSIHDRPARTHRDARDGAPQRICWAAGSQPPPRLGPRRCGAGERGRHHRSSTVNQQQRVHRIVHRHHGEPGVIGTPLSRAHACGRGDRGTLERAVAQSRTRSRSRCSLVQLSSHPRTCRAGRVGGIASECGGSAVAQGQYMGYNDRRAAAAQAESEQQQRTIQSLQRELAELRAPGGPASTTALPLTGPPRTASERPDDRDSITPDPCHTAVDDLTAADSPSMPLVQALCDGAGIGTEDCTCSSLPSSICDVPAVGTSPPPSPFSRVAASLPCGVRHVHALRCSVTYFNVHFRFSQPDVF